MKYIKLQDSISEIELTPRPVLIEGWGNPKEVQEISTIDGNIKDFIPVYKIRKMVMVWENLDEDYRDIVLSQIKEFTSYSLKVYNIFELNSDVDTENVYTIQSRGIRVEKRRAGSSYLYSINFEIRDRVEL